MSSSSHEKRKRRKKNKSSNQSNLMVDRISDLPDEIICDILYSFPTKFAATTSVLSKRWRYLWLSVLALNFDSRHFKTSHDVLGFVMDRRDITLPTLSFRVKYHNSSCCNQEVVDHFVQHVMQRGIQNFDLDLSKDWPTFDSLVALPVTILSCRTLKVLKLTDIRVTSLLKWNDLHLPSLKTLHLKRVYFESYPILPSLLLSCPILEDLETISCDMSDLEFRVLVNFGIVLHNLKKARISEFDLPLCAVSKAQILRIDEVAMFTRWTQILMFQNLTSLDLNFYKLEPSSPRWTWLLEILKLCPKLQNLIVKDNKVLDETDDDECWKDPPHVPVCLSIQLKICSIINYKGKKYDLEFAKYIIENSKLLDTMIITSLDRKTKQRMSKKLSSCTRGSTTCKLFLDGSYLV